MFNGNLYLTYIKGNTQKGDKKFDRREFCKPKGKEDGSLRNGGESLAKEKNPLLTVGKRGKGGESLLRPPVASPPKVNFLRGLRRPRWPWK